MKTKSPSCKRKNKLFIFDLDHTLIKGNCSFHFGVYLFRQNILPFRRMLQLSFFYLLFKAGIIDVKKLHEATFNHFFFNLSANTVDHHASQFLSQNFNDLIYQPAFAKLQEAKSEGYYTAILSSSPDFLVEKVASILGVDTWDSTIYQKNKCNHFSHILQFMEGNQKAKTLFQLIEDLQITKNDVTVYTDSYLDLPLLQAAGNPTGVNPDRRLRAICRQQQWPII